MPWRRRLEPFARPFVRALWRLRRGMTLGVRGVVTDAEGKVLLVSHTYVPGWHLPGGGVERGENAETAIVRELQEEAGVQAVARPRLISAHEHRTFPGDHVLVYRIDAWTPCAAASQGEIEAIGWFAPSDLPPATTAATRQRIAEALGGADPSPHW